MTVMRTKLEEALTEAHLLQNAVSKLYSTFLNSEHEGDIDMPSNRLSTVIALYFPTLRLQSLHLQRNAIVTARHAQMMRGPAQRYNFAVDNGLPHDELKAALDAARALHDPQLDDAYGVLLAAVSAFERECAALMQTFLP
jgi:hypothetical protein